MSAKQLIFKLNLRAHGKDQDFPKKSKNNKKSIRKSEKGNCSKNQFKSKYAVQKIARRMPSYASTALKSASLKSIAETKIFVKKTIKTLKNFDVDFRKVFLREQMDSIENEDLNLSDNQDFPKDGLNDEEFINFCKLYQKDSGSLYAGGRMSYDRYFSDVNSSRLNFECRKHSGIRILLRGDLLGALNCFFPQLRLVPSEANPKKPILNKNFSNYSYTYKELEESFALARNYRKELYKHGNRSNSNNFHKEKQTIENSVENFVITLEKCELNYDLEDKFDLKNSKKLKYVHEENSTLYELKPAPANTSLKSVYFTDVPIFVEHSKSNISAHEERISQFGLYSKSEPQLKRKLNEKDVIKNTCLKNNNSEYNNKTVKTVDSCVVKETKSTYPSNRCWDLNCYNQNIYPSRFDDFHILEGVVNELDAFIQKHNSSSNVSVKQSPRRCTYSSVLKSSFIPDRKKIFTNNLLETQKTDQFISSVEQNLNKIEINTANKCGDKIILKSEVVYNEQEFEQSLIENIERILEDDSTKPETFYENSSSAPELSRNNITNICKENNKMLENLNREFLRIKQSQSKYEQYQTVIKNQLISRVPQTSQSTTMQTGFISPKRAPNMYEVEAFNKFIQQNFNSQNTHSLNQNFGNLLTKLNMPQQSSSMFSQMPQFSMASQINATETPNKCNTRTSQPFQVLQNHGSTTPQMNSNFYTQLNRELTRPSMVNNNSKINVRTIISASDLEKQAIEQYRQSDESLNSPYDVLEREAEEQYNNYNGQK